MLLAASSIYWRNIGGEDGRAAVFSGAAGVVHPVPKWLALRTPTSKLTTLIGPAAADHRRISAMAQIVTAGDSMFACARTAVRKHLRSLS